MLFGAAVAALGGGVTLAIRGWLIDTSWVRTILAIGGVLFLAYALLLIREAWLPRISYADGSLRLHVRLGPPVRVPVEIVEAFLLGQGGSGLPGEQLARAETVTLVIRLAERAREWERHWIHPALGSWCGHYVTLRGTWCERLNVPLVNRLNARLAETKRRMVAVGGTA